MKKINENSLRRIKEKALDSFVHTAPKNSHKNEFMAACWTNAVLDECVRLGLIDFTLDITTEDVVASSDDEY